MGKVESPNCILSRQIISTSSGSDDRDTNENNTLKEGQIVKEVIFFVDDGANKDDFRVEDDYDPLAADEEFEDPFFNESNQNEVQCHSDSESFKIYDGAPEFKLHKSEAFRFYESSDDDRESSNDKKKEVEGSSEKKKEVEGSSEKKKEVKKSSGKKKVRSPGKKKVRSPGKKKYIKKSSDKKEFSNNLLQKCKKKKELERIPKELERIPKELKRIPNELERIPKELERIPKELFPLDDEPFHVVEDFDDPLKIDLKQEKMEWDCDLKQDKMEWDIDLIEEKMEWDSDLKQEKVEWDSDLKQGKVGWDSDLKQGKVGWDSDLKQKKVEWDSDLQQKRKWDSDLRQEKVEWDSDLRQIVEWDSELNLYALDVGSSVFKMREYTDALRLDEGSEGDNERGNEKKEKVKLRRVSDSKEVETSSGKGKKFKKSSDRKEEVIVVFDINEEVKRSSDSKEEAKRSSDRKEKVKRNSDRKEVKRSSDRKEVKSSDRKEVKRSSDRKDVKRSSDRKEVKSSDRKEEVKIVFDRKEEVQRSSDRKDEVKIVFDRKEEVKISSDRKEVKSSDRKEVKSSDRKEVKSSDRKEVKSSDRKEVKSSDRKEVKSSDRKEVKSSDRKEVKSSDRKEVKSSDRKEEVKIVFDRKEEVKRSSDRMEEVKRSSDRKEVKRSSGMKEVKRSSDRKEEVKRNFDWKEEVERSSVRKEEVIRSFDKKKEVERSSVRKEKVNISSDSKGKVKRSCEKKEEVNISSDRKEVKRISDNKESSYNLLKKIKESKKLERNSKELSTLELKKKNTDKPSLYGTLREVEDSYELFHVDEDPFNNDSKQDDVQDLSDSDVFIIDEGSEEDNDKNEKDSSISNQQIDLNKSLKRSKKNKQKKKHKRISKNLSSFELRKKLIADQVYLLKGLRLALLDDYTEKHEYIHIKAAEEGEDEELDVGREEPPLKYFNELFSTPIDIDETSEDDDDDDEDDDCIIISNKDDDVTEDECLEVDSLKANTECTIVETTSDRDGPHVSMRPSPAKSENELFSTPIDIDDTSEADDDDCIIISNTVECFEVSDDDCFEVDSNVECTPRETTSDRERLRRSKRHRRLVVPFQESISKEEPRHKMRLRSKFSIEPPSSNKMPPSVCEISSKDEVSDDVTFVSSSTANDNMVSQKAVVKPIIESGKSVLKLLPQMGQVKYLSANKDIGMPEFRTNLQKPEDSSKFIKLTDVNWGSSFKKTNGNLFCNLKPQDQSTVKLVPMSVVTNSKPHLIQSIPIKKLVLKPSAPGTTPLTAPGTTPLTAPRTTPLTALLTAPATTPLKSNVTLKSPTYGKMTVSLDGKLTQSKLIKSPVVINQSSSSANLPQSPTYKKMTISLEKNLSQSKVIKSPVVSNKSPSSTNLPETPAFSTWTVSLDGKLSQYKVLKSPVEASTVSSQSPSSANIPVIKLASVFQPPKAGLKINPSLRCQFCKIVFLKQESLKVHLITKHKEHLKTLQNTVPVNPKPVCIPLKSCKNVIIVPKDSKKTEKKTLVSLSDLLELERELKDRAKSCSECQGGEWWVRFKLKKHSREHSYGDERCSVCWQTSVLYGKYMSHLESHAPVDSDCEIISPIKS